MSYFGDIRTDFSAADNVAKFFTITHQDYIGFKDKIRKIVCNIIYKYCIASKLTKFIR